MTEQVGGLREGNLLIGAHTQSQFLCDPRTAWQRGRVWIQGLLGTRPVATRNVALLPASHPRRSMRVLTCPLWSAARGAGYTTDD